VPGAPRARPRAREGWSSHAGLGLGALELAPGEAVSLFPAPATPALALPRLPDPDEPTRARLELELLGLTVRTHPVRLFPCANVPDGDARAGTTPCAEVRRRAGERVALLGWLAASRRVATSDGRWMRFLTLEDESGIAEVVLFPDVYERDGHRLASGRGPYRVTGTVEDSLGACALFAERIG
jgi:DNA polymerase III alpha subunit